MLKNPRFLIQSIPIKTIGTGRKGSLAEASSLRVGDRSVCDRPKLFARYLNRREEQIYGETLRKFSVNGPIYRPSEVLHITGGISVVPTQSAFCSG
jgi:hypothetical protein